MLKIRLMGTKNDIKWFKKILKRESEVTERDHSIKTRLAKAKE